MVYMLISFSDEVSCHVSDSIHLTCSQPAFLPNVQIRTQGRQAVSLSPARSLGNPWPSPGRTWWQGCRQLGACIHPEQSHWRCLSCSQASSCGNKYEEPGPGCFLLRAKSTVRGRQPRRTVTGKLCVIDEACPHTHCLFNQNKGK